MSGSAPTLSVVAYVHDYADYLAEAIDSILAQSHDEFDLFVLDDGSTDATPDVLAGYARDPRVRCARQARKGRDLLHETFNRCLAETSGDLIAIANGDDVMEPGKLEKQVAVLRERTDLDVSFHDAHHVDGAGRPLQGSFAPGLDPVILEAGRLGPWMFERDWVPNPTVVFRRRILDRIGLQEYGWMHDYQFWLKAAVARCRFHFSPERLLRYRVHDRSHSTSPRRLERLRAEDRRMRLEVRARYTIEQLYPEIESCADPQEARAAAHLDLGLRFASASVPLLDAAEVEFAGALAAPRTSEVAHHDLEAVRALATGRATRVTLAALDPASCELYRRRLEAPTALPTPSAAPIARPDPHAGALARGIDALQALV